MKAFLVPLLLLPLAGPAMAQQSVPEIPFDSVPDFLKLPPGMNFGEVPGVAVNSKGHVFVFTRSNSAGGPAYAPAAAQLLEFGSERRVPARNRQGPLRLVRSPQRAHRQGRQHLGHRQGLRHDHQVQSGGPRRHGSSAAGRNRPTRTPNRGSTSDPPLAADRRTLPPAHRRRLGFRGQHLHHRRLRQFARRQIRQERRLGEVMGRARAPGRGSSALPHAIVDRPQQQLYVGDRTNRRIQVFDTDGKFLRMFTIDVPPVPGTHAVNGNTPTGERLAAVIGAPNSICITPGPNQVLFVGEITFPGRIFKVSLDGKVLGVIGRSGRQLKQFSGAHAACLPVGERNLRRRNLQLAGAEASSPSRMRAGRNDAARSRPEACTMRPQARNFS